MNNYQEYGTEIPTLESNDSFGNCFSQKFMLDLVAQLHHNI